MAAPDASGARLSRAHQAQREAQIERVASVLMALETCPAMSVRFAPVLVLTDAQAARAVLGLHIDGRHVPLALEDARLVARALRMEGPFAGAEAVAAGFEAAIGLLQLMLLGAGLRAELATLQRANAAADAARAPR